ncbi:uncharacterized protein Z518_09303 [Rhinocladiella mackenziei CBS 650.93]|uniref:Exonuclease domain-containing protein n=1 Tax=Rhinocladiella mackenziei CBS 650.93 TaxID=1442369 RepID=A0A0D2FHX7_9EURO|nr:uncharacterized protein Z518_09303 [Rhinocladiella mackenziei CBS 650.93]KIX01577.1 hypothetical protein Z518_09303 [Rhinocladiella mackenziei CBS 650.93]
MISGSKRSSTDAGFSEPDFGLDQTPTSHSLPADPPYGRRMSLEDTKALYHASKLGEPEPKWTVAESKSSRKKKRRKIDEEDSENHPSISFLHTKPARVQLKALQDLVLYVLSDGVAPTWLAVNNSRKIEKVVVVMIPGLDRDMLDESGILNRVLAHEEAAHGGEPDQSQANSDAQDRTAPSANTPSKSTPLPDEFDPTENGVLKRHLASRLLEHIIEVKAPGDSRSSRVHSPLQGMLIAPLPDTKERGNSKNEKSFQATRTPIANFVHSADELRESEYPVHPAAFINPKDAQLEKERRERTFQSISSGWVDTNVSVSQPTAPAPSSQSDPLTQGLKVYAIDCEMVLTNDDQYSLARISVINWQGTTMLDKFVKPSLPIKDYFTQYSGVTEELLKTITTTLEDIQSELLSMLGPDTILLGHSLESDLNALKLTHPFIVDTSIIYPHPRGLPLRSSLKFLANRYLKREIQKEGANGHDSVEDARAVLDLVRLKCEKGPKWGTLDANGESIFRRIGRSARTDGSGKMRETAIVEYGTPERGLGKDTTYQIACENDEDIVQGVYRAVNGDSLVTSASEGASNGTGDGGDEKKQGTGERIPPGGVDFVWARLRDLETVQGWNTPPPPLDPSHPRPQTDPPAPNPDLLRAATRTLTHLLNIFTSLPPGALLITYSGTSDMRPLLRLQQMHAQYRREFKVRKWNELSVKWTDVEEQALRKAVENARKGVGVLAVR